MYELSHDLNSGMADAPSVFDRSLLNLLDLISETEPQTVTPAYSGDGKGESIYIPGHTTDGALIIEDADFVHTYWDDGMFLSTPVSKDEQFAKLTLPDGSNFQISVSDLDTLTHSSSGGVSFTREESDRSTWFYFKFDGTELVEETAVSTDGPAYWRINNRDGSVKETIQFNGARWFHLTWDNGGNLKQIDGISTTVEFRHDSNGKVITYNDRFGTTWNWSEDRKRYVPDNASFDRELSAHGTGLAEITTHLDGSYTLTDLSGYKTTIDAFGKVVTELRASPALVNLYNAVEKFSALDIDNDLSLSHSEVRQAIPDPQYNGGSAAFLNALKLFPDMLRQLDSDVQKPIEESISLQNARLILLSIRETATVRQQIVRAREVLFGHFNEVDKDRSGYVEKPELESAFGDDNLSRVEREALGLLIDHMDEPSSPEVFLPYSNYEDWLLPEHMSTLEQIMIGTEVALVHQPDKTFASDNPIDAINAYAIRQRYAPTCAFLAVLASVAQERPSTILDMIEDNGNGTYTVTFPGEPDHPITVTELTETERTLYADVQQGLWPAILEKAYATRLTSSDNLEAPQETAVADLALPMWLLTGEETDKLFIDQLQEGLLENVLVAALERNLPVAAAIKKPDQAGISNNSDLVNNHGYSVLNFDQLNGSVQIRNPWGWWEPMEPSGIATDGLNDGVFEISLTEFKKEFSYISIAGVTESHIKMRMLLLFILDLFY